MGGGCTRPELPSLSARYGCFLRDVQRMQGMNFMIAVDFTYANILRARGWGRSAILPHGSLHAQHMADGVTYVSPYELCLKHLEKVLAFFHPPQNHILFCPFAAGTVDEMEVPLSELVSTYKRKADDFNSKGESQFAHKFDGSMIPVAVDRVLKNRAFTCLLLLTSGQIADTCQETQMVIDASRYPVVISTVGIGDRTVAHHQFRIFHYLDEGITASRFDNYHFWGFPYFSTIDGKVIVQEQKDLAMLTAVEVFAELPGQYHLCERLGYLEALRKNSPSALDGKE